MLALAAAPNERGSVKYNNCAKSDINKTSRRNTVFKIFFKKKGILIASRRKKWLWKEFDTTARRERSKSGFRVRLTRVSHSLRKRG